ncbi:MAG: bifunctional demethylmenaquinone methyltransferase/2-methoxy-6-polyprenyl-1,4-benzoquinol methylase UbiE [Granulosicoccus sp.]|nr:bifunctional demethylmenaquinone methyltransferase/2-methoxy-6-polyprenyl-1,4-benzoquinol methylase UbiE [Granulosicoccus sp.]
MKDDPAAPGLGNEGVTEEKTHFGYESIDASNKSSRVGQVFDSVATRYDVMNDLMSLGIHRIWKRFTISQSGVRPGQQVLDLAGGTGDLAAHFSKRVGKKGLVVLADINATMLETGRDKLTDQAVVGNLEYVQADAEQLPFADESFDCLTIAFGLRNVTDKDKALRSMYRVLKTGGRLLVLEFSKPVLPLLSKAYDAYSFSALPLMGKLIANDEDSYRYLAESIRMHPDQTTLESMLQQAGFERTGFHNLTGGIVALHKGYKI